MTYTVFDPAKPADTETGTAFDDSARANLVALRDAVIMGKVNGWTLSVSGGTAEEPAIRLWSNGTLRIRASITYASGYITAVTWEYSSNSGSSYDTIASETATYDGSGNQTAGNNSGLVSWLFEWIGKFKALRTTVASHTSSIAALGSMSTQNGTAVSITGGTIKGTSVGGTGASEQALAHFLSAREKYVDLGSHGDAAWSGNTVTVDLATGGHFRIAPTGNFTIAWSNAPTTGFSISIILEIVNAATRTLTLPAGGSWGAAGAPTWTANTDFVQVVSRNAMSNSRFIYGSPG